MKTTYTFDEYGYHTWRDMGGFLGLLLDGLFCVFVIITAFFMMVLATVVLGLDYLVSPVLRAMSHAWEPKDS